jgi:hypothetical protein
MATKSDNKISAAKKEVFRTKQKVIQACNFFFVSACALVLCANATGVYHVHKL